MRDPERERQAGRQTEKYKVNERTKERQNQI